MSQQFRAAVVGQLEDLYTAQLEDVTAVPALDEDFQVEYESLYEETCAALPVRSTARMHLNCFCVTDMWAGSIFGSSCRTRSTTFGNRRSSWR